MANYILAGAKMSIIQKRFKICFFGPSGSGKSTAADIAQKYLIQQNYLVQKVNVGEPLHQIQEYIYSTFNLSNTGQDGPLLQFVAKHFESQLGPHFSKKIQGLEADNCSYSLAIINSDCRDNSYQYLKNLNFKFIRVLASKDNISLRLQVRGDINLAQKNHSVEQISQIIPDYLVDNNESIISLKDKIETLINLIINQSSRTSLRDLF